MNCSKCPARTPILYPGDLCAACHFANPPPEPVTYQRHVRIANSGTGQRQAFYCSKIDPTTYHHCEQCTKVLKPKKREFPSAYRRRKFCDPKCYADSKRGVPRIATP